MRHHTSVFALSIALLGFAGCKSTSPNHIPEGAGSTPAEFKGMSLAEMEAEYAKLRAANEKRCLYATLAEIRARQAECEAERKSMVPLGNALYEAKLKEAQRRAQQ